MKLYSAFWGAKNGKKGKSGGEEAAEEEVTWLRGLG